MENVSYINSIEDLKVAMNNPYRMGEYLCDNTQIFEVMEDDNDNIALIETYGNNKLWYAINWEDDNMFTEEGVKIEPVY